MSPPATADKKQSAFAPKQNLSSGHKLSPAQTSTVPQNLQNNIVVIPALSQPSFGSFFLVNVATHGVQVENISLQFQVNALFPNSGLTYVGAGISGSATTPFNDEIPFYSPSSLWIDHVEVTCNNIILDTIYGPSIHIHNNVFYDDKCRNIINNDCGNYASVVQRQYKAQQSNSEYTVNLHSFVDECPFSILNSSQDLQLRVYLQPLANCFNIPNIHGETTPAFTGTPQVNLICNALVKQTNLTKSGLNVSRLQDLQKSPLHQLYHDSRMFLSSIQPCKNSRQILTSLVGNVSVLYFVVNTKGNAGDNQFYYDVIESFEILDSSSTNIVGGNLITNQMNKKSMMEWSASSYTEEWAGGFSPWSNGVTDLGSNVYFWSFSQDPQSAHHNGSTLSSHKFMGNETLSINFTQSFANGSTPAQLRVFALTEQMITVTTNNIKKEALQ